MSKISMPTVSQDGHRFDIEAVDNGFIINFQQTEDSFGTRARQRVAHSADDVVKIITRQTASWLSDWKAVNS